MSVGAGALRATWGNVSAFVNPVNGQVANIQGLNVPFAPAYTANTTLEWTHNFAGYELGSRGSASFIGRSYWDPQDAAYQQAYHLVNMAAWLGHDHWKVTANVTNLTQTQYNTYFQTAADVGAPFNIARIGRPRWFTVTASVRF